MARHLLTLDLQDHPETIAAYRAVHAPAGIWPEIPAGIREVGIAEMEIYLQGSRLCMVLEAPEGWDFSSAMARLATLPRQAAWEAHVSQFQKAEPGSACAEKWRRMERVFRLSDVLAGVAPEHPAP